MRELLRICAFRLKLIWVQKAFFAALTVLPLIFMLVLGDIRGFQQANLMPVAIVDQDQSDFSRLLVERFTAKEGLQVTETDEQTARALVAGLQAEAAFIIRKGFKQGLLAEEPDKLITLIKSPNSLSHGILQETLAGEAARLAANSAAANWVKREYQVYGLKPAGPQADLWGSVWNYTDSLWEPEPLMKLEYQELSGSVAKPLKPLSVTVALSTGMLVMFLMLLVMFYSSWLIEERNNGTLKRLLLVPRLLEKFYLANILGLFFLALGLTLLAWGLVRLFFGVALFTSGLQLLVLAAYILSAISVSLLLAALLRTPDLLQSAAPLLSLLGGLLGGCLWSFLDLPGIFRFMAYLTPQGWALEALLDLARGEYSLSGVALTSAILTVFAVLTSAVSYMLTRKNALT